MLLTAKKKFNRAASLAFARDNSPLNNAHFVRMLSRQKRQGLNEEVSSWSNLIELIEERLAVFRRKYVYVCI